MTVTWRSDDDEHSGKVCYGWKLRRHLSDARKVDNELGWRVAVVLVVVAVLAALLITTCV